jgi:hypothetical protein
VTINDERVRRFVDLRTGCVASLAVLDQSEDFSMR